MRYHLATTLLTPHRPLSSGFPNEPPPFEMVHGAAMALVGGTDAGAAAAAGWTIAQLAAACGKPAAELTLRECLEAAVAGNGGLDVLNQYSIPYGKPQLRAAIMAYVRSFHGVAFDAETEVTCCLGATEGFASTLRAVCEPGDAVAMFQPYHELYTSQVEVFGMKPRFVTLGEGEGSWGFDREAFSAAVSGARAFLFCSPHNPTGKVFSAEERQFVLDTCCAAGCLIITDDIYEHITYNAEKPHVPLWAMENVRESGNVVAVNSASKTGSATGWRVGWILASPELTVKIRGVHDSLVIQAPTPMQAGCEKLLQLDKSWFAGQAALYKAKRDLLLPALEACGFVMRAEVEGSYYVFGT